MEGWPGFAEEADDQETFDFNSGGGVDIQEKDNTHYAGCKLGANEDLSFRKTRLLSH